MRRRAFVRGFGMAIASMPFAGIAQSPGRVWRIGMLGFNPPAANSAAANAFDEELRRRGYVVGRNLVVDGRYYGASPERVDEFAAELVRLRPDVIVTAGGVVAALAARRATSTVPIVMAGAADPVLRGLATSLARPGGNVTGLSSYGPEIAVKRLEILFEAAGKASHIAYLQHRSARSLPGSTSYFESSAALARSKGAAIDVVEVEAVDDLEPAFATMARQHVDAVLVDNYAFFYTHASRIAELALRHRLATVGEGRVSANAGLLVSFGVNREDLARRAAIYVDKILKGADPAELPIEQPERFELFVNLKTAKAIGVTIPQPLLLRADEVIE